MKNLSKHLKAIIKKNNPRVTLQGVFLDKENEKMIATDSHRALGYRYSGYLGGNKIIDLETLKEIEGQYPNVSRLFEGVENSYSHTIPIDFTEITKGKIKLLAEIKKERIDLKLSSGVVDVYTKEGLIIFSLEISKEINFSEINEVSLTAEYLKDFLNFALDYGKFSKDSTFHFLYVGNNRPLLFKTENFSYLIAPIREN